MGVTPTTARCGVTTPGEAVSIVPAGLKKHVLDFVASAELPTTDKAPSKKGFELIELKDLRPADGNLVKTYYNRETQQVLVENTTARAKNTYWQGPVEVPVAPLAKAAAESVKAELWTLVAELVARPERNIRPEHDVKGIELTSVGDDAYELTVQRKNPPGRDKEDLVELMDDLLDGVAARRSLPPIRFTVVDLPPPLPEDGGEF